MSEDIAEILVERGKNYGKFKDQAEIATELKLALGSHIVKHGKCLFPFQEEALDMICSKLGRIVNGDADYVDSWVDIAGYAQLVADQLREPE